MLPGGLIDPGHPVSRLLVAAFLLPGIDLLLYHVPGKSGETAERLRHLVKDIAHLVHILGLTVHRHLGYTVLERFSGVQHIRDNRLAVRADVCHLAVEFHCRQTLAERKSIAVLERHDHLPRLVHITVLAVETHRGQSGRERPRVLILYRNHQPAAHVYVAVLAVLAYHGHTFRERLGTVILRIDDPDSVGLIPVLPGRLVPGHRKPLRLHPDSPHQRHPQCHQRRHTYSSHNRPPLLKRPSDLNTQINV